MSKSENSAITVSATVNASPDKVWNCWTSPMHITKWNHASDDWHSPEAENDLRAGGKFRSRMAAKDGSMSFDFEGIYDKVEHLKLIEYTLGDGRKVRVTFEAAGDSVTVTETFDAEQIHSQEMQKAGWQAILDNFKKHTESTDMEKLHFETEISASAEKVFTTMLDKEKYCEWTSEFNASSRYEGSWEKGASIRFIGCDDKGNTGGMIARIKENVPNRHISIEHLGIISGDKEITEGPEIDSWKGALENYTLEEKDGKTFLKVDMDANEEFKSYFIETWPKALAKLKSICEA